MRACAAVVALTWAVASAQPPSSTGREPWPGLDAYVTAAMATWHTTGLALAIVRHDSVIYAKGYGVRTVGSHDPVDDQTLFALGSCSKAFTSTAVAMLVDSGKLRWDDRVTTYLPEFQVADPYVTRELTIRDVLAHRTGVDPADFLWYYGGLDRAETLRRMRYLRQTFGLRSQFDYVNLMYLAAGEVVARVSGLSWDAFVKQRILDPLHMSATVTRFQDISTRSDVASPHRRTRDVTRVVPWYDNDDLAAAGGVVSNARDMGQWLRFQLAHDTVSSVAETHRAQTIVPFDGHSIAFPTARRMNYGMGWLIFEYHGHTVLEHDGDVDGYTAEVQLLPDDDFGVAILVNDEHSPAYFGIQDWLKDHDLHLPPPARDWTAELHRVYSTAMARQDSAEARAEAARITGTHPTLPLARYAGTYADSAFGTITVQLANDTLHLARGPLIGVLQHWNYDTFRALWQTSEEEHSQVVFGIDGEGVAHNLTIEYLDDTVTFTRVPAPPTATSRSSPRR